MATSSVRDDELGAVAAAALAFTGSCLQLGHRRDYIFEIAIISIDWITVTLGAFLMLPVFRSTSVLIRIPSSATTPLRR